MAKSAADGGWGKTQCIRLWRKSARSFVCIPQYVFLADIQKQLLDMYIIV